MKHPFKRIALAKIMNAFFAKLMQHPDYYNIRYSRKGNKVRNHENFLL